LSTNAIVEASTLTACGLQTSVGVAEGVRVVVGVGVALGPPGGTGVLVFVGVGVGVGYSLSQDWNIKTQAGVARQLRTGKTESTSEKDAQNNAFFGGVMLDYRF